MLEAGLQRGVAASHEHAAVTLGNNVLDSYGALRGRAVGLAALHRWGTNEGSAMNRSVVVSVVVVCIVAVGGIVAAVAFPNEIAEVFSSASTPSRDPVVGCWESQLIGQATAQCFSADGSYSSRVLGFPGAGRWERLSDRSVRVESTTLARTTATVFDMWIVDEALHMQTQGEREVHVFRSMVGATALEARPLSDEPLADEGQSTGEVDQMARERLARESATARLSAEAERAQEEARAARAQAEAAQAEAARAVAAAQGRSASE